MSFSYPVMLDVRDRAVVVFGGGAVAARKVKALLDAGATFITVVAPEFHADLPADARRIAAAYHEQYLDGADLVFAATSAADVNDAIVRDCRKRRVWVNRVDADSVLPGDFATPAQLRKGPVTVTVSAGSAALTAAIRDGIADRWDDRWTAMAAAMRELRPLVVNAERLTSEQRAEILRKLAGPEAMELLAARGMDELRSWLRQMIEGSGDGGPPFTPR